MIGGVLIAVVIVVVLPVAFMMSGAAASVLLGWLLRDTAERDHAGSELIDLNR